MDTFTMRRPDNWHVHFRDDPEIMAVVVPATARVYARALVMPNTIRPILRAEDIRDYMSLIGASLGTIRSFTALPTIKLTPETTPEIIQSARNAGAVAAKLYPAGVTTGSHGGIEDPGAPGLADSLEAMADCGMVLCVHAERPGYPVLDAETDYLVEIFRWHADHPRLRIVIEHISTHAAVEVVAVCGPEVAATITPMHLTMTLDDILGSAGATGNRGLNPHNFCYPVAKTPEDRTALIAAATSGNPKFFLGDDSAPHLVAAKEAPCGAAGCYSAPASLPTYAEVFEAAGQLDRLEDFASRFGAEFYGLPLNEGTITLRRTASGTNIPPYAYTRTLRAIRPWRAGERLRWAIAPDWSS